MAKSNGIRDLKQAAKLLNKHAPDGEKLAYINKKEAELLRAHGGSGIQTLQGVPSYISIFGWEVPGTSAIDLTGSEILGKGAEWLGWKDDKGKIDIGEIGKDAMSVWGALKAKKDQEGLNAAEMEQFNKLNQQMAVQEAKFLSDISGQGTTNVPTKIEDVASFTDVTLPALKTTAVAEGGRIGYNSGSIDLSEIFSANDLFVLRAHKYDPAEVATWKDKGKGLLSVLRNPNAEGGRIGFDAGGSYEAQIKELMDKGMSRQMAEALVMSQGPTVYDVLDVDKKAQGGRIGYNLGGIGAMDPRIGYQMGSPHGQVIPTFSEGVQQMYESGPAGVDTETINYTEAAYPVIREKMKSYAGMIGSDNIYDIIKIATQVGDKEFVDYLRQTFTLEGDRGVENPGFSTASGALGAAYGGRIGAKEGGIMPLLNLGGMEKDYRQDGGFVPIGRREKADDVPARLSKNEFVFTADAVRNAGGGDIDKGAQRMYNVMKNLEAGGEISEQSQGQV